MPDQGTIMKQWAVGIPLLLAFTLGVYLLGKPPINSVEPTTEVSSVPLEAKPVPLDEELKAHVTQLATEIGERNLAHIRALEQAAQWIESQFRDYGLESHRQTFEVNGLACHNIIAEIGGTTLKHEIVVVGAHYDSVRGSPGANDNASGVASLLALARRLSQEPHERSLRFVAFTNEEPPWFQNPGQMGSWVYARQCRKDDDQLVAVLSLETMGYYSEEPKSQKYPAPLNLMYPHTGNFIGFVGNLGSGQLVKKTVSSFKQASNVPVEFAILPEAMPGVGWSDHWSFWQEGYAGLMITDTAPFRYPHYHLKTDTPDKIDFETLANVVEGLLPTIRDLANPPDQNDKGESVDD